MALIAVGEKAPSFDLVNQDGKSISLETHKGKFVLMCGILQEYKGIRVCEMVIIFKGNVPLLCLM